MKIIFSPAKEMNLGQPLTDDWEINPESQPIISALQQLSEQELAKALKVKGDLLADNQAFIADFKAGGSYLAMDLYHGLAYRTFKTWPQTAKGQTYLNQHLRLLSALYGPILPKQRIKPYRLDFNMVLRIEGRSLRDYWQEHYPQAFTEGELIMNLASQEFASRLNRNLYDWLEIDFYERKAGKLTQHSTLSKKGRGTMLAYLASNQVKTLKMIKAFDWEGYQFAADLSDKRKFVFVREVQ